jgi:hypothetical protein
LKVSVDGQAPPQKVLSDATRPRPLGRPKAWAEDEETKRRERAGAQNMQFAIDHPNRGTFKADDEGLSKAYADTTYEGVYYDPGTRTMYVKGTVPTNPSDWWDDISKIPVWGDIHDAARMKHAEAAYKKLMEEGKPVDRVVGHSLGGSVALQLQRDKDIPLSRTFGAPVLDLNPNPWQKGVERYRHPLDPFSITDWAAAKVWDLGNVNRHSFGGFSNSRTWFGTQLGA